MRWFVGFLILILAFGASARADETPVKDYIRLHVLAEDDGAPAQALKLKVRDAVLDEARALLAECGGADEAWAIVGENLARLADVARVRARDEGYLGAVTAETGVFAFPDRHYGGVSVPAGEYRALRIVIGAGEGRNWWCVLYPSLCLPEDAEPGAAIRFHSVILDWLRELAGGEER